MIMFVQRLKELMKEHDDITQIELAKRLGYNEATFANWCTGRREPGFDVVCKIADYFKVSTDYLLGRSQYKNPFGDFLSNEKPLTREEQEAIRLIIKTMRANQK